MSRGMGRIERAILAAFVANPDAAFSTDELCIMTYGAAEKRHRVALVRAANSLCSRSYDDPTMPGIQPKTKYGWRGPCIWVNRYSLRSVLTADAKHSPGEWIFNHMEEWIDEVMNRPQSSDAESVASAIAYRDADEAGRRAMHEEWQARIDMLDRVLRG